MSEQPGETRCLNCGAVAEAGYLQSQNRLVWAMNRWTGWLNGEPLTSIFALRASIPGHRCRKCGLIAVFR